MKNFRSVIFIGLLVLIGAACNEERNPQPTLVLTNGHIWTGQDSASFVEAIAIRGNIITHVGSTKDIQKLAGDSTRVIDLNGRLVTAGFNDAHIHFLGGSMGLTEVELTDTKSREEVIAEVKRFMAENPAKAWITGRGWQYIFFATGMPDHTSMAELQSDRPVFIKAYDGHSAWANRTALAMAGINAKTVFKGFGEIVRDKQGQPTGALKEDAMDLVGMLVPQPSYSEQLEALRKGLKLAASLGITTAQNANGSDLEIKLFSELLRNNELTLRYAASFWVDHKTTEADIKRFNWLKDSVGTDNNFLRADAIKFMLDGVIESHSAAMILPYADLSANDQNAVGTLSMPLERYQQLVTTLDSLGFRMYTHSIGDLAVREALNAYEAAAKANGTTDRRHRVEHIETVSPDDLPRFKQLGVMASMEPIHADPATMGVWEKAIGEKRLPYSFAWRSMLQQGAHLVYSSDWPAAISINPIRGIHVAVNRRTPDGFPEGGWIPAQRISIHEALKAYTYSGAYSSFEENKKGLIAPGYLADVIALSDDLFLIEPMKIHQSKVVLTVMDGRVIFEEGGDKANDN